MAWPGWREDALHHAGQSLGERVPHGSLRDELLNGEIFYSLAEARVLIKAWRRHDTTKCRIPHSVTGR